MLEEERANGGSCVDSPFIVRLERSSKNECPASGSVGGRVIAQGIVSGSRVATVVRWHRGEMELRIRATHMNHSGSLAVLIADVGIWSVDGDHVPHVAVLQDSMTTFTT